MPDGENFNPDRQEKMCVTSGATTFLLFGFAKWINTDARTTRHFAQSACVLLSGLLFGMFVGFVHSAFTSTYSPRKSSRHTNKNFKASEKPHKHWEKPITRKLSLYHRWVGCKLSEPSGWKDFLGESIKAP